MLVYFKYPLDDTYLDTQKHEEETMSIFKRLSTTLFSRIDHVVGEIEDHDAVIEATIREMHKKMTEAKVRLGQVNREKHNIAQQLENQQLSVQRWRDRAVTAANEDESKAFECLSRAKLAEQQAQHLQTNLAQYEETTAKLTHDLRSAEQRLNEIKQKRSMMRARQSSSEAILATQNADTDTIEQLDKTFGRWEVKLGQSELYVDEMPIVDHLEKEYLDQENHDELRAELDALLNKGAAQ